MTVAPSPSYEIDARCRATCDVLLTPARRDVGQAEQDLSAKRLQERTYDHNPDFQRFLETSGLPFRAHAEYMKADVDTRQEFYWRPAGRIWSPGWLGNEAAA